MKILYILGLLSCCLSALRAQPIVNLGADLSLCGSSYNLDAGNAGATYVWSTGATSQQITATASGTYWVDVTDISGTTRDSIVLELVAVPTVATTDTTICAGPNTLNVVQGTASNYFWYDAPTAGNLLHVGQSWTGFFANSATYYVGGQNLSASRLAGYANPLVGGSSNYYFITAARGLIFNISQPLQIVSVNIPVQGGNLTATLEIRTSAGVLLYTQNVSLAAGTNTVFLYYNIAVGMGYRILLTNIAGTGNLHVGTAPALSYPQTANGVSFTSGLFNNLPNTGQYNFFYNFQVAATVCSAARQPTNITVNPSPIVSLPNDTSSCFGSLSLDATWAGATYLWQDGSTTATTTYNSNANARVTVTANGCSTVDSSRVLVAPAISFVRADTTACSGAQQFGIQGSSLNTYYWYDAPTGGNLVHVGQQYSSTFNNSATYHIEGRRVLDTLTAGYTVLPTISPSGYYAIPDVRGMIFDITTNLQIISVDIPVQNGGLTGVLEIRNSSNAVLYSRPINLVVGTNTVSINYALPIGTGYRIVLTSLSGTGRLHVGGGAQVIYPNLANGLRLTSSLLSGAPNTSLYFFFYNFKVSSNVCVSARQPFNLTITPSPILNFSTDTVVCAQPSLTLDAANIGAAYLWSTGETTAQINVQQTSDISVIVNLNNCIARDTVAVSLLDTAFFMVSDTTFCAGLHTINVNSFSPTATYFWWNAPTGGSLVTAGGSLSQTFAASQTLYVQGQMPLSTNFEGLPNNTLVNGIGSAFHAITDTRGLAFTARNSFLLRRVNIYADGFVTGTVELQLANGTTIASRAISLVSGLNQVLLDFAVPAAGNYRLVLRNPTGGGLLFVDAPNSGTLLYPLAYDNIIITSSVINNAIVTAGFNGQIYSFFYNWEIVQTACPTGRYPLNATVLPTPYIVLPSDTVFCATSATVDAHNAGNAGATYVWSTGVMTNAITTTQGGLFSVTATIGQCTDEQEININLANPPTQLSAPNDTTVCGGQLTLYSSGNGFTQAWYNSANATTPIAIADSLSLYVGTNTTLWLEAVGFVPKLATYGLPNPQTNFPTNYISAANNAGALGIEFDVLQPIRLDKVSLYVDSAAVDAKITLYDTYGFELQSQWVNLPNVGENVLNLNWVMIPANGYRILLDSISGGKVYVEQITFPFAYSELRMQRGAPNSFRNIYSYFYKWKISVLGCASARDSVQITVPPYPVLTAPADTSSCDNSSPIVISAAAANPNYTYLWSNGATTNSITATNTGYYSATVSNGGICQTSRNTFVQFLQTPALPNLSDTLLCASSYVGLLNPINGQIYQWFDLNAPNTQIYLSAPYYNYVADTSQYVVSAAARATTRLGLQSNSSPNDATLYSSFNIPNTFDVNTWAVFDSVAVYVQNAPTTFDLVIRNAANVIVYNQTYTVSTAKTKVFLPINTVLPPNMGYQLAFQNYGSSNFLVDYSAIYPMTTTAQIATLTSTPYANVKYPCFFDWHFSYAAPTCAAVGRDTFAAAPRLPLLLPLDTTFVCDTFYIDLSVPAATQYTWSTGATTAQVSIGTAGTYTVTVSDGQGCFGIDTLQLTKPIEIGLPAGNFNCDSTLFHNYSNAVGTTFAWNTGDTTRNLYLINGAGEYILTVTTAQGCTLVDTANIAFIDEVPFFDLGNTRTLCNGDSIRVSLFNPSFSYLWSNGSTSQTAIINGSNNYVVTVTTANQCTATDNVVINARERPTAAFSVFFAQGLEIGLSNLSQNFNIYYYNYGDSTPITTAAFHRYDTAGCYNISLVVQSVCGADTASLLLAVDGFICDTTISVATLSPNNPANFVLLPNPSFGDFVFKTEQPTQEPSEIYIYNSYGALIRRFDLPASSQYFDIRLQELQLSAGTYFVRWQQPKYSQVQKIILLR